MTSLRRRMIEDMQVRNLSPHNQTSYVQQVSLFARHFHQRLPMVRFPFSFPARSEIATGKDPTGLPCEILPKSRCARPRIHFSDDRSAALPGLKWKRNWSYWNACLRGNVHVTGRVSTFSGVSPCSMRFDLRNLVERDDGVLRWTNQSHTRFRNDYDRNLRTIPMESGPCA
jgi:hypothetical protein